MNPKNTNFQDHESEQGTAVCVPRCVAYMRTYLAVVV